MSTFALTYDEIMFISIESLHCIIFYIYLYFVSSAQYNISIIGRYLQIFLTATRVQIFLCSVLPHHEDQP